MVENKRKKCKFKDFLKILLKLKEFFEAQFLLCKKYLTNFRSFAKAKLVLKADLI